MGDRPSFHSHTQAFPVWEKAAAKKKLAEKAEGQWKGSAPSWVKGWGNAIGTACSECNLAVRYKQVWPLVQPLGFLILPRYGLQIIKEVVPLPWLLPYVRTAHLACPCFIADPFVPVKERNSLGSCIFPICSISQDGVVSDSKNDSVQCNIVTLQPEMCCGEQNRRGVSMMHPIRLCHSLLSPPKFLQWPFPGRRHFPWTDPWP